MSASDITEVGATYIRPDSTTPSSVASTLIPTMGGVSPITSTEPTLIYPSSYPLDMGHKGQKIFMSGHCCGIINASIICIL